MSIKVILEDLKVGLHHIEHKVDKIKDEVSEIGEELVILREDFNITTMAISNETSRAIAAEGVLTADLAAEVTRAMAAEDVLTTDLAAEVTRATAAEGVLTTGLAAEVTRATTAEGVLAAIIGSTSLTPLGSHSTLTDAAALTATAGLTHNSLFATTPTAATYSKFFKSFMIASNLDTGAVNTPYPMALLLDFDFQSSIPWTNGDTLASCLSNCRSTYTSSLTDCTEKLFCIASNLGGHCGYSACTANTFTYLKGYGAAWYQQTPIGDMLAAAVANELC